MVNVIGVRFKNAGKLFFFDPGENWPTPGDFVVVETTRGVELGEVVLGVREINDENLAAPLTQVIRIASAEDVAHDAENKAAEKEAYEICQKKISEHKLDMKLVSVEYTFDNSKVLFYFTANGRVDFRSLVKDLAGVFRTRIELRQIGVRDEAKMLGGLGPCGRPICCGTFLGDFQPVSIKMAKEQNLSLNPTKISGVCGRLMCCLKYEEDTYEQVRKSMPKVGREVMTPDGPGVVWDVNVIKETVRVRVQKGDASELKDYPNADVQRIQGGRRPAAPVEENAEKPVEAPRTADAPKQEDAPEKPKDEEARPARPAREKNHRNDQAGKPVRRENPNRKETAAPAEAPAQKAAKADKPEKPQPQSKPAPAAKPAANAWKLAVEQALRAAQGGDAVAQADNKPSADSEKLLDDAES